MVKSSTSESQKYNKNQKIKRIIEVTKNLIENSGIEHTNTNYIAKQANVSIGILYRYFPDGVPSILLKMSEQASKSVISKEIVTHLLEKPIKSLLMRLLELNLKEHRTNKSLLRAFEVNFLLHPELFPEKQDLLYFDWEIIGELFDHYHILDDLTESKKREQVESLLFIIDALTHEYLFNPAAFDTDSHFLRTLLDITNFHLKIQ